MARKKGTTKTGGRKAGTPNKNKLLYDVIIRLAIEGGVEKLKTELDKLNEKEYINAFIQLGKCVGKYGSNDYTYINEMFGEIMKQKLKLKKDESNETS